MQQQTLTALLASVTGNLYASTEEEELELDRLQEQLAQTLQHQEIATTRNLSLSFESSDFFFAQNIKGNRLQKIDEKVKLVLENNYSNDLKVFVRETPIRSTQVAGSVPEWAGGGRVIKTLGPFIGKDGRFKWFDFYKVEKLVALYFQGSTIPAILFQAEFSVQKIVGPVRPPEVTREYKLAPGSVWVNARLLSNTAATNLYCGIRTKGGSITLSELPQLVGGHLTIKPNVTAQVALNMEQPEPDVTAASDAHGADARNLQLVLPSSWKFSFNASSFKIHALDPLSWTIYGQEGRSEWTDNQPNLFDGTTNRVLIPLHTTSQEFSVKQCVSPFQTISGTAIIKNSWWGIPTALIDVNQTVEADGNGAVLLLLEKGISTSRQGVLGTETVLPQPLLIAEPGRIGITDLKSNAEGSNQNIELWRDEINPHGTVATFTFLKEAPFVYNCLGKGDEVVMTACDTEIFTDRPVKVNGEALPIRTKKSIAMFASNGKNKIALLYDDNIIFDNSILTLGSRLPTIKPIALALENALFTTTPVNGCLLTADCSADWKKATYARIFLTLGLYAYLPTLPDPYAANLNLLKRQFAASSSGENSAGLPNQQIWLWLVCRISSKPGPLAEDSAAWNTVTTSFHFGNLPFDDPAEAATGNTNKAILNASTLRSKIGAEMLTSQNVRAAMYNVPEGESGAEEIKTLTMMNFNRVAERNFERNWDDAFGNQLTDAFALLDVSSNANQMGISFGMFGQNRLNMLRTATVADATTDSTVNNALPFMVQNMSVMAKGMNVRAFTLPQVAWEPVFNLAPRIDPMDPLPLFNYYPNDGGPTRLFNFSAKPVALAPLPVTNFLVDEFTRSPQSYSVSNFTLPFGMKAFAAFSLSGDETIKPTFVHNRPDFVKFKGGVAAFNCGR